MKKKIAAVVVLSGVALLSQMQYPFFSEEKYVLKIDTEMGANDESSIDDKEIISNASISRELEALENSEEMVGRIESGVNNNAPIASVSYLADEVAELDLPESIDSLGLEELNDIDSRVTEFFERNDVIGSINNGRITDEDRKIASKMFDYVAEVRANIFEFNAKSLIQEIKETKKDIIEGRLKAPPPLTENEREEIRRVVLENHRERMEFIRRLRKEEDERVRQEEEGVET